MALTQNEDGSWSGTDETDYSYDFGGSFDTGNPAFNWDTYAGNYGGQSFDTADPNFSFDKYMSGEYQSSGDTSSQGLGSFLSNLAQQVGTAGMNVLKGLTTDSSGKTNYSKLASLAGGLLGGLGANASWAQPNIQKTGYQGGIPDYTAVRAEVPGTYDPTRRPGSRGQEYFTATQFASPTDTATAQAAAAQQAAEAEARNKAREAEYKAAKTPVAEYAAGGLANLAKGRYLSGPTDGMADRLDATIENKQPAKLSHGEFVIPADVVGHLGNGNSEAGAQRLYDMMDRIRTARTGTKKQGKQINPNKYMPG